MKLLIRPALTVNSMVGGQEFAGCYIKTSPKATIFSAPVTDGIFAGNFCILAVPKTAMSRASFVSDGIPYSAAVLKLEIPVYFRISSMRTG